jgi:eukaryotic-like serine/threonine-protein kinase
MGAGPPATSEKRTCASCGSDLPDGAPAGLCEVCVAKRGADSGEAEATAAVSARSTIEIPLPPTEKPGDRIGRYKLLQQIGEGGCGAVYLAEQDQPVRRRVALKVIKLGMDTKQVIARFEAERQALALMDHPNIAKVLDAGATDTGRPYFVMELVRGIRITDYCDQNNLSTAERLDLFVQVCKAIQHAHQKGIIHRDIKPSNILVTLHDGAPVPKVIDFGIAKATDQRLTDKTLFTAFEQFMGTPAYMSPEQAEMSGLDIDTRSDIYALGVLLYELLTGKTPFDPKALLAGGLDQLRRTIREKEPERPSTRLSTMLAVDLRNVAKHRRAEPPKLIHLVRGDLDWIVMKALEKDRTRRYETANGLAMDVQRYLHNEPVVARPPSKLYRFQKLVRRNKAAFVGAGAVTAALVIGLGLSTWLFIEEKDARRRAVAAEQTQSRLREQAETEARRADQESRRATAKELEARRILYAADMNLAQEALRMNNVGRARALLERHQPEGGSEIRDPTPEIDLRGWEWRYLWRRCQNDALYELTRHKDRVFSLSFSADGRWLAIGHIDGLVQVWDVARRELLINLQTNGQFASVAFAPRTNLLAATAKAGTVKLWDPLVGVAVAELTHGGQVRTLSFSPDGKLLAIFGQDRRLTLWDTATTNLVETLTVRPGSGWFYGLAVFSPDSRLLAVGELGGLVRVLEVGSWKEVHRFAAHREGISALSFSPDGRFLLSGSAFAESAVKVWNLDKGALETSLPGHTSWICGLARSPDGTMLASASADQSLRLWDPLSWKEIAVLRGHGDEVAAVAFSPDGHTLASGSRDGSVLIWDTSRRQPTAPRFSFPRKLQRAWLLADGKTAATVDDSAHFSLWNLATFQESPIPGITNALLECARDGKVFTYDRTNGLEGWDIGTQPPHKLLSLSVGSNLLAGVYCPERKTLAWGNRDGVIRMVRLEQPDKIILLEGHTTNAYPTAFGLQGRRLLSADQQGAMKVWDVDRSAEVAAVRAGKWEGALLSPNSRFLAVATTTQRLMVWDLENLARPPLDLPHKDLISDIAFSPASTLLVSATQLGQVRLWDLPSGTERPNLRGHLLGVHALAFSPDGQRLATGSSALEAVKLWDVATGQEVATLDAEASLCRVLAFSEDGNTILVGGTNERTWHLWQAPSFAEIAAAEHGRGSPPRTASR